MFLYVLQADVGGSVAAGTGAPVEMEDLITVAISIRWRAGLQLAANGTMASMAASSLFIIVDAVNISLLGRFHFDHAQIG